jgi:hypothetical protein
MAMGGTPGIVSSQGGDDGWAEEAKGWAGVLGEEKRHKMFLGEVRAEVVADVEDAYEARHGLLRLSSQTQ